MGADTSGDGSVARPAPRLFSKRQLRRSSPQKTLLEWYRHHGRRFPWRHDHDIYRTIVAEMLLQRTRASQVEPVYAELLARYPNAHGLASAKDADVELVTQSLGLPARANRLAAMAKALVLLAPCDLEDRRCLEELPGVGSYVADAVEAFVFRRPVCALDANVVRFLGRFYGVNVAGEARRRRQVRGLADGFVQGFPSDELNWALLDHGALVCTPKTPRCEGCSVSRWCSYACQSDEVGH